MPLDNKAILEEGRKCLELEIDALQKTLSELDGAFVNVVNAIEKTVAQGGKLIFSGVGKNQPICEKLVGTFNSTGVPATFLNPIQALHGDLGLCMEKDLALMMSNSGETEELLCLLTPIKRLGVKIVGISAVEESTLMQNSDLKLTYQIEKEACPLNLAPTASTTVALALGDALAMACLELRGFSREDFALYHPAGNLGKQLLLRVSEIMRTGEHFALADATITVQEALLCITQARCGTIVLKNKDGTLAGIFTDGDFRRASLKHPDVLKRSVTEFMTRNPRAVSQKALAVDALRIFEANKINDLVVVDDHNIPVGLLDGQDLPSIKLV
jgi:arabinose-5-phosphate isomerase